LPVFPALALLIACHLEKASHKAIYLSAGLLALVSGIGLAFVSRVPQLAGNAYELPLYQSYTYWVSAAAIVALAGSLLAIGLARRQREWSILVLAGTGFFGGQMMILGHEPLGRYAAGTLHVPAIQAELTPQTPLYVVGRYEQALPFYLGRTMTMVEHADELEFGLQHEPHLWIPSYDAFVTKWTADHAAGKKDVAIINPNIFDRFQKIGVPMRVISQDPRRVIVTNDLRK
jgi:hypothetical protein